MPRDSCYRTVPVETVPIYDRTDMCEALARNLNAFCDRPPMICGLEIADPTLGLALPEWQELDIEENMELLEDLVRGAALRPGDPGDLAWANLLNALRNPDPGEVPTLRTAEIDIMNRGELDTVYSLDLGKCATSRRDNLSHGPALYLHQHAEVERDPAWRARAENGLIPFPGARQLSPSPWVPFIFQGRTFLYSWSLKPTAGELVAPPSLTSMDVDPQSNGLGASTVCQIEYERANSIMVNE
jgi:hypothetical protein